MKSCKTCKVVRCEKSMYLKCLRKEALSAFNKAYKRQDVIKLIKKTIPKCGDFNTFDKDTQGYICLLIEMLEILLLKNKLTKDERLTIKVNNIIDSLPVSMRDQFEKG